MSIDLTGRRVLVTGGTGFIGGRLIERLVLEHQAQVRTLVHNFAHAGRIARLPIEMVPGDVTNADQVRKAAEGCDVIFHCAYGREGDGRRQRQVTVGGTESVMKAALATACARVVYTSSLAVYGRLPDGVLDETAPRRPSHQVYGDSKLEAEKLVLQYVRREQLPAVILQPTLVYGPWAPWWTVHTLEELRSGRVILVNGGDGLCNAVYIDDAVTALLLAAVKKEASGEVLLISGSEPVAWRDFYGAYERMLGVSATLSLSAQEARACFRQKAKSRATMRQITRVVRTNQEVRSFITRLPAVARPYQFARARLPQPTWENIKRRVVASATGFVPYARAEAEMRLQVLDPAEIEAQAAKPRVSIAKARRLLGYEPAFDLERGMQLTAEWAKWANLV